MKPNSKGKDLTILTHEKLKTIVISTSQEDAIYRALEKKPNKNIFR